MSEENSESDIANLPFPHSRVKDILKSKLKEGTYIKKQAAIRLNLWLGEMAEKVAKEVSKTNRAYISSEDVDRVINKYDSIDEVEKEKRRISAHLNALREDINRLLEDLERI